MIMRHKHVPQRTCIVCRQVSSKRELIRLVRTNSGVVEIDVSGKKPGRGAYLCHTPECWGTAFKKRGILERALQMNLSPENRLQLMEFGQRFNTPD